MPGDPPVWELKKRECQNWNFWVKTRKLFVRLIWPLKINWWQYFYSRWCSFRVIVNQKFAKFSQGSILSWHFIFSVIFFSLFFLHNVFIETWTARSKRALPHSTSRLDQRELPPWAWLFFISLFTVTFVFPENFGKTRSEVWKMIPLCSRWVTIFYRQPRG